jgi:Flp pilus assembly protein TadB
MRISDAERNQMSDLLSKHFAEGRLTDTEFHERVDRAMRAKTRGDLDGLLDDLPRLDPGGVERRRRGHPVLLFVLVALLAVSVAHVFWFWHVPWLVIGVVAFFLWRWGHRYSGRLPVDQ